MVHVKTQFWVWHLIFHTKENTGLFPDLEESKVFSHHYGQKGHVLHFPSLVFLL